MGGKESKVSYISHEEANKRRKLFAQMQELVIYAPKSVLFTFRNAFLTGIVVKL